MNFLADNKKSQNYPYYKESIFREGGSSSSVVVACGRGPILIDKKLMVEFSADGRCYRDSHSGGVVALGLGLGGLKVDFGVSCLGGRHDSGPGPRLLHLDVGLGVAAARLVARV